MHLSTLNSNTVVCFYLQSAVESLSIQLQNLSNVQLKA